MSLNSHLSHRHNRLLSIYSLRIQGNDNVKGHELLFCDDRLETIVEGVSSTLRATVNLSLNRWVKAESELTDFFTGEKGQLVCLARLIHGHKKHLIKQRFNFRP